MAETQQIERSWRFRLGLALAGRPRWRTLELYQPSLFRMDRQTVLAESLRQHVPHTPRIVLSGKPDDEVVGVTDHKRTALEARLHHLLDPFIQHIVQVDVGEPGEITPPCGLPASGYEIAPSSITPALSHLPINRSTTPSRTLC